GLLGVVERLFHAGDGLAVGGEVAAAQGGLRRRVVLLRLLQVPADGRADRARAAGKARAGARQAREHLRQRVLQRRAVPHLAVEVHEHPSQGRVGARAGAPGGLDVDGLFVQEAAGQRQGDQVPRDDRRAALPEQRKLLGRGREGLESVLHLLGTQDGGVLRQLEDPYHSVTGLRVALDPHVGGQVRPRLLRQGGRQRERRLMV